ncbi:hypothetical protein [Owenweeksia hongkongensis]|uniref:DUF4189 domain-containing protein n=1 Tax=Owenweeksia hongkongensis (strain DSM 17368 / CIP 108786 / JCM 12287 / NRRL B-23963 / UST20020801) TaxID=926562 RepID=G8R2N6_OWEHD|nr:hypothetical protein [Owenweeksia hongkongensis]AEV31841.1 hypothetical protein Oweho_0828 [Owenweeksia hongkongensis DSM 17368]
MKKLLFVFAIAAIGSLASCKKDYTCECTILGVSTSFELEDQKKGDAEDACDALEAGGSECELK